MPAVQPGSAAAKAGLKGGETQVVVAGESYQVGGDMVVAIDGKVLRRSFDTASSKSALHMVTAWGCDQRLVLAQIATDAKSNEITAVPRLLDMLPTRLVAIEARSHVDLGLRWRALRSKRYGDTVVTLARSQPASPAPVEEEG